MFGFASAADPSFVCTDIFDFWFVMHVPIDYVFCWRRTAIRAYPCMGSCRSSRGSWINISALRGMISPASSRIFQVLQNKRKSQRPTRTLSLRRKLWNSSTPGGPCLRPTWCRRSWETARCRCYRAQSLKRFCSAQTSHRWICLCGTRTGLVSGTI